MLCNKYAINTASSTPIDSRLILLILGLMSSFLNEQFKGEKTLYTEEVK